MEEEPTSLPHDQAADRAAGQQVDQSHNQSADQGTNALLRWHGFAALACVIYVAILGIVMAIQLHAPEFLGGSSWLTWGRLRYAHTQGLFFGWLGNAFLAFLYYAVPRLAGRPVTGVGLGWVLFIAWNFLVVLPGWVAVHAGFSQPLEWAEFPLPVDAAAIVGLFLTWVQFAVPLLRARVPSLYVSAWYVLGGLTFTMLAYPIGNIVPELLSGAQGATFSGLWIHDAVGLYVTPMALTITYAVIPVVTRQPIYSHFMSMIGFWMLFLLYPLNGTHHYVFSSIPMEAQKGAIVASVYLGADVIVVVVNLLLSLRGQAGKVAEDVPLRFIWLSIVAYLVVSLQGSMHAIMPVNSFIHFTDWVIGHSHLAMIGFASFAAIGGMLHAWRRTAGCRYNAVAANWAFWLLTIGMAAMVLDLTAAGLVQGKLWQGDGPWIDSVTASQVYWVVRSVSGVAILAGFLALVLSMTTGVRVTAPQQASLPVDDPDPVVHDAPAGLGWLKSGYILTAVAGLGLFLFSFVLLGVWPNETLRTQIAETQPINRPTRTASEERGRVIFGREGCTNCHSQLVRFTEDDVRRFGVASQAWESDGDTPQMWGTRRIGPDLAREGGRRSRDWHLAHLWNPRHVVPASNMPNYPWLFEGSATKPTQEALDVVNYLDSLGRDARMAGLAGPKPLPGMDPEEERRLGMFCDCAIPRTSGAGPIWTMPPEPGEQDRYARRGAVVFTRHCVGCHGSDGKGDGPAAQALTPTPRNLTAAKLSDRAISTALWSGKPGSAMPAWADLPAADLRGLVAHLRSLNKPEPATTMTAADKSKAAALFATNCVVCHGPNGAGDGVSALRVAPLPTNFREIQPSKAYAETVISDGVRGTTMPRWTGKLTPEERHLLAEYVRTFYSPKE